MAFGGSGAESGEKGGRFLRGFCVSAVTGSLAEHIRFLESRQDCGNLLPCFSSRNAVGNDEAI